MPDKKKPIVEIMPTSEAALMPKPPAANLQAMIDHIVRERVDEIMAERGAALESDFQPREVLYEIRQRQTVFERRKWSLYFEKWGCRKCGRKKVSHASGGFCGRCQNLFQSRLTVLKREYERANPELEIQRQIDHITSRVRTAEALLVESKTQGGIKP